MNRTKIKENFLIREEKKQNVLEMKRKKIIHQLNNLLPEICKNKTIDKMILYGSILEDNFNDFSDLDIYIEGISAKEYWELLHFLNKNIDIEIDIATQDDDKNLIEIIKKIGKILYERKN